MSNIISPKHKANINPNILYWLLQDAGISINEFSERIDVEKDIIEKWLAGKDKPSFNQLIKLGVFFKRPISILYLQEPPKKTELPKNFRRNTSQELSLQAKNVIREAIFKRENVLNAVSTDKRYSDYEIDINQDPENAAKKILERLNLYNIISKIIVKNHDTYEVFKIWREIIESQNIIVFQTPDFVNDYIDGVSLFYDLLPIIILNSKMPDKRKIFTLLHEYIHILLNKSCISNNYFSYDNLSQSDKSIEIFCNNIAGAILVPQEFLIREELRFINDKVIDDLANKYSVSKQVIVFRLYLLNYINYSDFSVYLKEYNKSWNEYPKKGKSGGGPDTHYYKVVSQNGYLYTNTVFNAFENELINPINFYRLIKVKYDNTNELLNILIKHKNDTERIFNV